MHDTLLAAFEDRLERIEQGEQKVQSVLPAVLVHPELGARFYRKHVPRVSTLLEEYLSPQIEQGHIQQVNVPLTPRVVQRRFVGLLVARVLGDEPLQSQ